MKYLLLATSRNRLRLVSREWRDGRGSQDITFTDDIQKADILTEEEIPPMMVKAMHGSCAQYARHEGKFTTESSVSIGVTAVLLDTFVEWTKAEDWSWDLPVREMAEQKVVKLTTVTAKESVPVVVRGGRPLRRRSIKQN